MLHDTHFPTLRRISNIALATVLGFEVSLLFFIGAAHVLWPSSVISISLQGQLVAGGDPGPDFPTTAGILHNSLPQNAILSAVTSYLWWTGVVFGAMIATSFLLKIIQQYRLEPEYERPASGYERTDWMKRIV